MSPNMGQQRCMSPRSAETAIPSRRLARGTNGMRISKDRTNSAYDTILPEQIRPLLEALRHWVSPPARPSCLIFFDSPSLRKLAFLPKIAAAEQAGWSRATPQDRASMHAGGIDAEDDANQARADIRRSHRSQRIPRKSRPRSGAATLRNSQWFG